jgi:hypothetical protein
MKQSKFSLADVLTVLTALTFGYICFLGKNFSTLGNTSISITWAAVIAVSLAGTALLAKLLKRTSSNFKTYFILELIVILLFSILTVFFSYSPFPHYFNVSANKTEIQNKLQTSITQAENMFTDYEAYVESRKRNYKGQLETAVYTKTSGNKDYTDYGFVSDGGVADEIQINNKLFTIHSDLYPTNYSDTSKKNGLREVATGWLEEAKNTNKSWRSIGIVNVVNHVKKNSEDWKNKLVGFSKVREKGEKKAEDFKPELSFDDVQNYFTIIGKPTPLSIALAVVAYLLMLMSWFITKRHSRSTGILTRAPYEIVL